MYPENSLERKAELIFKMEQHAKRDTIYMTARGRAFFNRTEADAVGEGEIQVFTRKKLLAEVGLDEASAASDPVAEAIEDKTVAELKAYLDEQEVEYDSKLRKAELLQLALSQYDAAKQAAQEQPEEESAEENEPKTENQE